MYNLSWFNSLTKLLHLFANSTIVVVSILIERTKLTSLASILSWWKTTVYISPSALLRRKRVQLINKFYYEWILIVLTCSLIADGLKGSSQNSDVELSEEHRQHLSASTMKENTNKLIEGSLFLPSRRFLFMGVEMNMEIFRLSYHSRTIAKHGRLLGKENRFKIKHTKYMHEFR